MEEDNQLEVQKAWKLLLDKDLSMSERMQIKNAFANWGKINLVDYTKKNIDIEDRFYVSTLGNCGLYGFSSEKEVKFFNALHELVPQAFLDKKIEVMKIVMKLLDVPSEYTF
jgi:hypothetical protein